MPIIEFTSIEFSFVKLGNVNFSSEKLLYTYSLKTLILPFIYSLHPYESLFPPYETSNYIAPNIFLFQCVKSLVFKSVNSLKVITIASKVSNFKSKIDIDASEISKNDKSISILTHPI